MSVSDFPDWQDFGIQTVPLYSVTAQTVGIGATNVAIVNSNGNNVTPMSNYLSWDLSLSLICSALSPGPFIKLRFTWADDSALSFPTYREEWIIPAITAAAACQIIGNGPVRGAYLGITVDNYDTTFTMGFNNFKLIGTTRPAPVTAADIRSGSVAGTIPGYTIPTLGTGFDGLLGHWHSNVVAGGTAQLICGLFNGPVYISVSVSGTSPNLTVQIDGPVSNSGPSNIDQAYVIGTLASSESFITYAPRMPIVLELTNNNGTNGVTYTISANAYVTL